jgi:hypothetical protein
MACPDTKLVPPGFFIVIFAETSGSNQSPVALQVSFTEDPVSASAGEAPADIDRATA